MFELAFIEIPSIMRRGVSLGGVVSSQTSSCPIHDGTDQRKSAGLATGNGPATVWHRDYAGVRAVLRDKSALQAGFAAERTLDRGGLLRPPILFLSGEPHRRQRRAAARFFTPAIVADRYRDVMEETSGRLLDRLKRDGHADLDKLSLEMAVAVAAEAIGLTNSKLHGMVRRLNAFFTVDPRGGKTWLGRRTVASYSFFRTMLFHFLDVRPAIAARRSQPREDVISHLLSEDYSEWEILTECITYGAAGMITTREFITMAGWHLLERPDLKAKFLAEDEAGQHAILEEILRVEPVVAALFRKTDEGVVGLDIRSANTGEGVVGKCPMMIEPGRERSPRVSASVLAFGDGEHRCPGAYLALHESAIFLSQLLRIPGLRMERAPTLDFSTLIMGYELRGCRLTIT
jgi:cytochrome P450